MGLSDKAKDFLSSDKGEKHSDDALDRVADAADGKSGGKHADKIQQGRDAADKRIGTE